MSKVILQEEINELIDQTVYIQIVASFAPNIDFRQIKEVVSSVHDFIKYSSEEEVKNKLPDVKNTVNKTASLFMTKFPLKNDLRRIAADFNDFIRSGNEVYTYGLEFGWLDSQIDLNQMNLYKDTPYHYRIGLAAHKGNGSIEEDFLLKDAFNVRTKAEYYQNLLIDYGNSLKESEDKKGKKEFNQKLYDQLSDIKFEIAAYSRLTIISFYAFVEGFVNSVGYSYLMKNITNLNEDEKELLSGFKKGRFLQLKSKIEKFQSLIRPDKKAKIIVSDESQISEDFKYFFDYYEQLRNSAMHYSPIKEKIWMKPQEWVDRAVEFSELSLKISLDFWKACYPNSNGPEYLGSLDYDLHLTKANTRLKKIQQIEAIRKTML